LGLSLSGEFPVELGCQQSQTLIVILGAKNETSLKIWRGGAAVGQDVLS